jgi:hypothetical protein
LRGGATAGDDTAAAGFLMGGAGDNVAAAREVEPRLGTAPTSWSLSQVMDAPSSDPRYTATSTDTTTDARSTTDMVR